MAPTGTRLAALPRASSGVFNSHRRCVGGLMICDICGHDPCDMPTFCQAAREHLEREKTRPKKAYAPAEKPKTWRDGLVTADALESKQFKPIRIVLPGIFPEGATIFAGKPKVGSLGGCLMSV